MFFLLFIFGGKERDIKFFGELLFLNFVFKFRIKIFVEKILRERLNILVFLFLFWSLVIIYLGF